MSIVTARTRGFSSDPAPVEQYFLSAQLKRLLAAPGSGGRADAIGTGPVALAPTFRPPDHFGTHYEDGLPTQIAIGATLTDSDSPDFDGGSLTVTVVNATQYDQLNIQPPIQMPLVVRTGNDVFYQGILIGTVSGGVNGAPLIILFNASATPAVVELLVQNITYRTTDQATQDGWRDIKLVVNDGDGGTAQIQTTVGVLATDDAPVLHDLGGGLPIVYTPGTKVKLDDGVAAWVTDVDNSRFSSGILKVSIVDAKIPGEDKLGLAFDDRVTLGPNNSIFVDGARVGFVQYPGGPGGGDLWINLTEEANPATVAVLLQHLTYANSSATPIDATKEILVSLNDGDTSGRIGTSVGEALVHVKIGTGIRPPPGPTVWPEGSILPAMPGCPAWHPNWSPYGTQVFNSYNVAQGTYIYSENESQLFFHQYDSGTYPPFVNDGTIWVDGKLPISAYSPQWAFIVGSHFEVINHGLVVVRHFQQFNVDYGIATAFDLAGNVTNSGEIWAWCENGMARTIFSQGVWIRNSGLIAARSENDIAVAVAGGATVYNLAGGRLLAEGVFAVAVATLGANVENDGLIMAKTTHPGTASVGIEMRDADGPACQVINRGTITADVAINEVDIGFSPTQHPSQIAHNFSTGVINGDIEFALGADQVINEGTINGYIFMGDDDDRVENTGIIVGNVDLGASADTFLGGAIAEYVAGMDGADRLEGNGGNDQLMGGGGDDVVIGGAGNDGLFGERGNDRIVTQDGDYVWGGAGDDRIELGDYRFEYVSGNEGFDTLVLPSGGRVLDLSLVAAEHALEGIEKIVLGGGKEIVVRAADVPAISGGGNALWLDGLASDKVDLVGAWVAGTSQTVDGVTWRRYDLGGQTVYVTVAATVQSSVPSNPLGLDPYPGGEPAPIPGAGPLDFTQIYVLHNASAVAASLAIPYDETWWNDQGAPVLTATGGGNQIVENAGHILSARYDWSGANAAIAIDFTGATGILLHNTNTIRAYYPYDDGPLIPEFEPQAGITKGIKGGATIVNDGLIEVRAAHGIATGSELTGTLVNHGTIDVLSLFGFAIGVDAPGTLDSDGAIVVQGGYGAIGVRFTGGNTGANVGFIGAEVTTSGESVGVSLKMANSATAFTFNNDGEIAADIAIRVEPAGTGVGQREIGIVNSGILDGRVELGTLNDNVINKGHITRATNLFNGDDIFDGSAGIQADVHGGLGNDQLTGGRGADRLFGDEGNDILKAGSGNDWLEGGAGADTFVFAAAGDSREYAQRSDGPKLLPDVIADFAPGTDKIDLAGIDAITGTGANDAFTFIGSAAFSHQAGQLRFETAGGHTALYADLDGDGLADMQIMLQTPVTLTAADFVL